MTKHRIFNENDNENDNQISSQNILIIISNFIFFSKICCRFLVHIGCASLQIQMITVLHSYLNNCEHGADWHSILFDGIIRHPDDLSNYIKSIESQNVDVSLKHKQMLLNMINTSVENPTVFSEVINGIQLGEQMHRFSVNVIFDLCTSHFNNGIAVFVQNEEAWLHLNIGSKTIECWIPYQSMTIVKVVIDSSKIRQIQIKKYVFLTISTLFLTTSALKYQNITVLGRV